MKPMELSLRVIERGLIPVYEDERAQKLINAREMHGFVESKQEFTNWIKDRIDKYGFVGGEDFLITLSKSTGGRPSTEYFLSIDMGKELAMVENNEKGRQVRKYFIQCEERAKGLTGTAVDRDSIALKRADAMLYNSRARIVKCLRESISDFAGLLSPQSKQAIAAYISDTLTGQPGLIPLPAVETTYTASQIGDEHGMSANAVGRFANQYGLKTPQYGFEVLDKAKGHNKQVPTFRYNEAGRARLAEIIRGSAKEGEARG
jgi:phage anti-repressor protein